MIDLNPTWKPSAYTALPLDERSRYQIKSSDIAADILLNRGPPNPMHILNKENTGVCPVVTSNNGGECGMMFEDQPALWRHLRNVHTGCCKWKS